MVGQFGTALVGLGQDCARDSADKQSPPYTLLVPRTGMGRRCARVGHHFHCFLVVQVTGLPCLLIISNTIKPVELILGCAFPAFSSLPSLQFTTAQQGCAESVIAPANLHVPSVSLGTSSWSLFHLH